MRPSATASPSLAGQLPGSLKSLLADRELNECLQPQAGPPRPVVRAEPLPRLELPRSLERPQPLDGRQKVVHAIEEHPRRVVYVLPPARDVSVHDERRAAAQRLGCHPRRRVAQIWDEEKLGLLHRVSQPSVGQCVGDLHFALLNERHDICHDRLPLVFLLADQERGHHAFLNSELRALLCHRKVAVEVVPRSGQIGVRKAVLLRQPLRAQVCVTAVNVVGLADHRPRDRWWDVVAGAPEAVGVAIQGGVNLLVLWVALLRRPVGVGIGCISREELIGGDADHDMPVSLQPPEEALLRLSIVVVLYEWRTQGNRAAVLALPVRDDLKRPWRVLAPAAQKQAVLDGGIEALLRIKLFRPLLYHQIEILAPGPAAHGAVSSKHLMPACADMGAVERDCAYWAGSSTA
mmetsp:Transcript_32687/g.84723  ORF Transcript_32687/g.84723 Transcript_32687/m.84723 type:complete len:405 (+) Transcript_32687:1105-2319(+)